MPATPTTSAAVAAPTPLPAEPPAFMSVAEILALMNADRAKCGLAPKNRWWARRVCEGMGIRFLQEGPGCLLRATGHDLVRSGFWRAFERYRRGANDDEE